MDSVHDSTHEMRASGNTHVERWITGCNVPNMPCDTGQEQQINGSIGSAVDINREASDYKGKT